MKIIVISIFSAIVVLSGCSSRNEQTNAHDDYREMRDKQTAIRQSYSQKEEAYISNLEEITFTGLPEDFANIVLEANSNNVPIGLPRYYAFVEKEENLQLEMKILEGEPENLEQINKVLVVDNIHFEEDSYTIDAEEYTFNLYLLEDSIKRLKDEDGNILTPSYYIPEELQEQWWEEAKAEEAEND